MNSHGLVRFGEANEVHTGKRAAVLLHATPGSEVAEIDDEEARVLEQGDHFGLRIAVVAGEKQHTLTASLVGIYTVAVRWVHQVPLSSALLDIGVTVVELMGAPGSRSRGRAGWTP